MTRRVVYHQGRTRENDELIIITVFESDLNKSDVKKLMPYSKKHDVLVKSGNFYDYK
ncbi:hypothetical protein WKH57_15320 [Niallia taxi]|uniref:hypothetical protein n=1 Tax=Niallia taxi TaxID=2499688 RepID=UPI00317075CF